MVRFISIYSLQISVGMGTLSKRDAEEDWLTIIHLPKKAPYLNPNERKVNQQIKSDVCTNRFYTQIEEQKAPGVTRLSRE